MPDEKENTATGFLNAFIERNYFTDEEVEAVWIVLKSLDLENSLLTTCQFIEQARQLQETTCIDFQGQLCGIVYRISSQVHGAIGKVGKGPHQDALIAFCFQLTRALILEFREACKDKLPNYLDSIEKGIKKTALVYGFDAEKRIEHLGLDKIRKMDEEEKALSKPSKLVTPAKATRRRGCSKVSRLSPT